MGFRAAIFDLDGTLINSIEDIAGAMNEVLDKYGYPSYSLDDYKYLTGGGAIELVKNSIKKISNDGENEIEKMLQEYLDVYAKRNNSKSKPYKGITETLKKLSHISIPLGVISNKPQIQVDKIVTQFFPNVFLAVQGSQQGVPLKPHPEGAIQMANSWNISPENIIFVGDSGIDMETAKNAAMYGVGALWGFRDAIELTQTGAKILIQHPSEIIPLIIDTKT